MTESHRLLFINQFFWPDWAATAQLLGDLAEAAAADGFEVTALAGRGTYASPEGTRLEKRQTWNGVSIRRVACTSFGRGMILGRISDYLTYFLSSLAWLLTRKRFDIVVCLSTPPFVALLGVLSRLRGSRFIYKVEDLYPDLAVALGVLPSSSMLTGVLRGVSSRLLKQAEVCVALDDAMGEVLKERGAREVVIIPNWADGLDIRPDDELGSTFRREHDLPDVLTVLYSGNLGNAHRFEEVCEAIQILSSETVRVEFLFVGAGPRLEEVKLRTKGLDSVRFLPYQPREKLGELYNAADLHLVTLRDGVAGKLVPSKYAAALAAGKPVLLVGGQGADIYSEINAQKVGWACQHDAKTIAQLIRTAAERRGNLQTKGECARALFEEKYSKEKALSAWVSLLKEDLEDGGDRLPL